MSPDTNRAIAYGSDYKVIVHPRVRQRIALHDLQHFSNLIVIAWCGIVRSLWSLVRS